MADVLQYTKELVTADRWMELRALPSGEYMHLTGDELAIVLQRVSSAWEHSANTTDEYLLSVRYGVQAVKAAEVGSLVHVWCLSRAAGLLADVGEDRQAEVYAEAYFDLIKNTSGAESQRLYVHHALARVYARRGWIRRALVHYDLAAALCRDSVYRDRLVYNQAFAYLRAGMVSKAICSAGLIVDPSLRHSLWAMIADRRGDWSTAEAEARETIAGYRYKPFDTFELADIYGVLRQAAKMTGRRTEAALWQFRSAYALHSVGLRITESILLSIRLRKGGAQFEAAAESHHGPAGARRFGLLGAVG